jgi:DNA-binding HxlR family transcriptional regulator
MACSIARTLDIIGEPWSPLILRDVYVGIDRFERIQADLGISRKVLTERLKWLVESGILERRQYERARLAMNTCSPPRAQSSATSCS